MATIGKCPSGALAYTFRGERGPEPDRPPAIRTTRNGPFRLEGGIRLVDEQGSKPSPRALHPVPLRRARNKPFCDGSHDEAPFES